MKFLVASSAFFVLLLLVSGCARPGERTSQEIAGATIEDFDFLVGTWQGTLGYLDYGDDRTQIELPTRAVYTRDDALRFEFVFTEPSGEEMKDRGTLVIGEAGEIVTGGETYRVVQKQLNPAADRYRIVFSGPGRDNNQAAQITHTIGRQGEVLTLRKDVVYDGATEPLLRHVFRLTRQN